MRPSRPMILGGATSMALLSAVAALIVLAAHVRQSHVGPSVAPATAVRPPVSIARPPRRRPADQGPPTAAAAALLRAPFPMAGLTVTTPAPAVHAATLLPVASNGGHHAPLHASSEPRHSSRSGHPGARTRGSGRSRSRGPAGQVVGSPTTGHPFTASASSASSPSAETAAPVAPAPSPASVPPGLAKKPGGLPPGLAKKPAGLPPGLAKKPGGLPPGQAKKR
jgi:hypothetical protein